MKNLFAITKGTRRFGMLSVHLLVMCFALHFLTSCDYEIYVLYEVESPANDTIDFIGWRDSTEFCETTPYITMYGDTLNHVNVCAEGRLGGMHVTITEEESFLKLCNDYDSVRLSRRSDGASTITYRHDENATEEQRYFFTREAWQCDPEGETLQARIYTFILPEMDRHKLK